MKNQRFFKRGLVVTIVLTLALVAVFPALAAPPPNDDFGSATVIPGIPFSDSLDTTEATTAADDPDCFGQGPTVWYAFTPGTDMSIMANTFGSDYDTTLSVYTGTQGNLTQLACNDDFFGVQSRVDIDVVAGETYFFMVGAFASGPGGNLVFNVDFPPPPLEFDLSVNPVGQVKASTGVVTLSGTVMCSRPAFVDLFGDAEQRAGRLLIHGFFGVFLECDGVTPWSASFSGENGIFKAGKVEVNVFAFAFTEDGAFAEDFESLNVQLRGPGK